VPIFFNSWRKSSCRSVEAASRSHAGLWPGR
jgi:hypothetical protein